MCFFIIYFNFDCDIGLKLINLFIKYVFGFLKLVLNKVGLLEL